MNRKIMAKLILPMMLLSGVRPLTSLTSCEFSQIEFKFNNEIVYLPLNTPEDLTQFMTIDKSILPREILWSSSDPDTIPISSTGLAYGKRATEQGKSVVITATLYGNSTSCRAIVGDFSFVTNMIVLRESSTQANIYETYLKSNSANINRYTTLSVEDESIAKVDANGNIIPVSEGLTKIIATSRGGTEISTNLCIERDILENFTFTETNDSSYIISDFREVDSSQTTTEVVLPRYKNGKPITYLGQCFTNNSNLTKVTVPDTYTKIVSNTFIDGCNNIENLILPDTIEDVKDYIFKNCSKLTSLVESSANTKNGFRYLKSNYPEGREESPKNTYLVALDFNTMGSQLLVDKECKVICHRALSAEANGGADALSEGFSRVNSLSFYQDSKLVCLSDDAFSGNTSLLNLNLPGSIKYIHNSLRNIGSLTGFKVPKSLEYIGSNWLDGTTLDVSTLDCFTTVDDLIYLGCPENKFLILYGLKAESGSVTLGDQANFVVRIQPSCRIIGSNAFQINSPTENWFQAKSNGLSRINPSANTVDTTNRLFTGTVSAEETSVICICGNAFKNCDYINNIILSSFVKYFDITGISSSGITKVYCESFNPPIGFDFSADPDAAKTRVLYQSVSYKTGNYWHYNDYRIPTQWDSEENNL